MPYKNRALRPLLLNLCTQCPLPNIPNHTTCERHVNAPKGGARRQHWTPHDDALLRKLHAKQIPMADIATALNRTRRAASQRLTHLLARVSNQQEEELSE